MKEKEKKIRARKIKKIFFFVAFLLFVVWVALQFIPKKGGFLSKTMLEISEQLEAAPGNPEIQERFIYAAIREQEQIDFVSEKKNPELLQRALDLCDQYLAERDNMYITLIKGRIHYQLAGIASDNGKLVLATMEVRNGNKVFDKLIKSHSDNLVLHTYRALNFSSLPGFFGKKETAIEEFAYVATRVLNEDSPYAKSLDDSYYLGAIVTCLRKGVEYYKEAGLDSAVIERAQEKAELTAREAGISMDDLN